ncbi:MAG: hypothetical protein ACJAY8_000644 [Sphingobacteriales bacterium]
MDLLNKISCSFLLLITLNSCVSEKKEGTELIFNPHSASGQGSEKLPVLVFEPNVHDFGVLSQGEKVEHTFTFTNEGDAPALIFDVKSDCGCTIPKTWPKDAIEPGDSGEILVSFNTEDKMGEVSRNVRISTNGNPSTVIVKIKAEVIVPNQLKTLLNQQ